MARIVTVYTGEPMEFRPVDMSLIRWLKISEALARKGHQVDIACNEGRSRPLTMSENLRRVPLDGLRWPEYDVVKTLFHMGYQTLEAHGGANHPFVISKLGSVVGDADRPGVFFYGDERADLYETQCRIQQRSRFVTLLTPQSKSLWREQHGSTEKVLLVPGAADHDLPPEGPDPYPDSHRPRALFAGNIYDGWYQADVHRLLVGKLNHLGRLLKEGGVRLHFLGRGDTSQLDPSAVTSLGAMPHQESWNYLRHADAGIVLAFGPSQNVNESTKIYHYLRAGLATVCEAGFPNEDLIRQAKLGFVVKNGDMEEMAQHVARACQTRWERDDAIRMILQSHTWDRRAEIYDRIIRR